MLIEVRGNHASKEVHCSSLRRARTILPLHRPSMTQDALNFGEEHFLGTMGKGGNTMTARNKDFAWETMESPFRASSTAGWKDSFKLATTFRLCLQSTNPTFLFPQTHATHLRCPLHQLWRRACRQAPHQGTRPSLYCGLSNGVGSTSISDTIFA